MADITPLTLSYPDFILGQVIDPEEFDQNNMEIVTKVNETIVVVNTNTNGITGINVKADNAVATANLADGKADNAVAIANGANDKSDNAVATANTASTNATNAVTTANEAKATANAVQDDYSTQKPIIEQAVVDANAAVDAVAQKVDKSYVDQVAADFVLGAVPDGSIVEAKLAFDVATQDELATHLADEATLNQLGHIYHTTLTTTLDTDWSGTEAPYTKTQTVTGISANDNPIVDVVMSGNFKTAKEQMNGWSRVYRITTADNSITLYATDKPTVSLPIQLKVVR